MGKYLSSKFILFTIHITKILYMDQEVKDQLSQEIEDLKNQLTGDMFKDMDLKDKIHNLEMKLKGVKPMDSSIDCIGCGS
ncbi:hypothetical protein QQ020_29235 [Fulvivirgaceae bacterium BMA12]|uniref:Uncharacterized protein n=1 Tax=Agaribacillus aureus TaxID=3051825 RepID=A0ABT8LEK3_9BACT|nr:hypothetical protein [Fulvivirgaceae bacterium BMA12]